MIEEFLIGQCLVMGVWGLLCSCVYENEAQKSFHDYTPYNVMKTQYMYHTAVATDSIEKYCMQYSDFNRLQQLLMQLGAFTPGYP